MRFLFIFILFSGTYLKAFDYPREISEAKIENAPIHFALLYAHETEDYHLLNFALKHHPIDYPTEKVEIVNENSKDERFHVAWEEGITPLEYAIRLQNPKLVEFLLSKGAKAENYRIEYRTWNTFDDFHRMGNGFSYYTYTPLYLAIFHGNKEIVEQLLLHGASHQEAFHSRSNHSNQAFVPPIDSIYSSSHLASALGHEELAQLFGQLPPSYPKVSLSAVIKEPNVKIDAINENTTPEAKYRISLSNQWTLITNDIDSISQDSFYRISPQDHFKEDTLPYLFSFKRMNKFIGYAIRIDASSATYFFFKKDD